MSTIVMTARIARSSPQFKARLAGGLFLVTILLGVFARGFIAERLIVSGDAAATAANILAHEALFRSGTAANLIATVCYVAATLFIYELLKPVNRSLFFTSSALQPGGVRRWGP